MMPAPTPRNFIAYHSVALQGRDLVRTQPVSFVSNKSPKLLRSTIDQRVWFIVGRPAGRRTKFWLGGVYTPSRIRRAQGNWLITGPGTYCEPEVELTPEPWFGALKRKQSNFSLGFNEISDPSTVEAFEALMFPQLRTPPWPEQVPAPHARSREKDGASFTQGEAFPLIAGIIQRIGVDKFVTQKQIATALLNDPVGSALVARSRARSTWANDRAAATNIVSWFSQAITIGRSEWSETFDRERHADGYAYRVRSTFPPDLELGVFEGEPRMVQHLRRERNRELAAAKRNEAQGKNKGRLICEGCDLDSRTAYPMVAQDVYEVHHRAKLSAAGSGRLSRMEDLAILCANCHRAIHRTAPMMTVEELREAIANMRGTGERGTK